jgi:hypothetical protein
MALFEDPRPAVCAALDALSRDPADEASAEALVQACARCATIVFGSALDESMQKVREAVVRLKAADCGADRASRLKAVVAVVDNELLPEYDRSTGCGR